MKCFFSILFLLGAANVFAGCDSNGCVGTPKELFSNYYLTGWGDGRVFFQVKEGRDQLDCTLVEGNYLTLKASHPLFKEIYSTVLAAATTDSKVLLRIKNGSDICEVSYLRLFL